jgi:uncharacterized iron-regulated protein
MLGSRVAFVLAAVLVLLACAARTALVAPSAGDIEWRAAHGRDDPRVGRIFDVARTDWIDEATLMGALASADFVLLGERHDHPDHHRLQARVIEALVARGRRPAIAFEMLNADDASAVAALAEAPAGSVPERAETLRRAVAWDESGWPAWALYAPVFEAAIAASLPIVAANLARAELQAIGRGGAAALAPARRAELGLDEPADPDEFQALAEQIREAHCGYAPEASLGRMVDVQRAWNAQLARSLAVADAGESTPRGVGTGAVLIAGSEHVRRDRGAPRPLAQLAPDARIATLGFVEIDPLDPDALPDATAPFDYVWLTPRVDLEDPCDKYREALEKLRAREQP